MSGANTSLASASAFLAGDVAGVDPSVTGREAFIAWLDGQRLTEDDWWVLLMLTDHSWTRRRPAASTSGAAE